MKIILQALLLALLLPDGDGGAQGSEEREARVAVEHYLKGHATGDPKEFATAFHEEARLFWVDPQDGLRTRTSAEYIAGAPGKAAPDEAKRKRRIVLMDVTRTAGMAKVELDYPDAHIVDYLALLKVNGQWKVINKIFTSSATR